MACTLINVGGNAAKCRESFSGISTSLYVFTKDDLANGGNDVEYSDTFAGFVAKSFAGVKVVEIKVKSKSGKITAESSPNGGGFSNVYTGMVANDMANMSAVARVMNNRTDWGCLIPTGNKDEYYVLYAPGFDTEFQMSSDTGDAPDSDHGHTLTITCAPMCYALPRWTGEIDVDTYKDAVYSAENTIVDAE